MSIKKKQTITKEWLKEQKACQKGYKWFRINFPDGLTVTKQNIIILFDRLLGRRNGFKDGWKSLVGDTIEWDTCLQMRFLLDHLRGTKFSNFSRLEWDKLPIHKMIDVWWEDYKSK